MTGHPIPNDQQPDASFVNLETGEPTGRREPPIIWTQQDQDTEDADAAASLPQTPTGETIQ